MPSHRDWLLYHAYAAMTDEFTVEQFYREFQIEIEKCRSYMRDSDGMKALHKDVLKSPNFFTDK